ncbi:DUF3592 domain-containing protein [Williamsia sterculiae]|uniref:DUF3592 domain-containing protein n=1 Tax=Williamsia sterculiae TaxID=1344003 RepID=A0A1N7D2L0_9NOCA|nr:DUF3592 domain-containing protein [Williamsia sterculiae]SIR70083.1 hypothetical protein SAMN05445060_0534 [Williamsia sterculiae]
MNATLLRRCQITLLSVGALISVMMLVMVAGSYLDDRRIDEHRAVAVGDVVSAGTLTSAVNFYTPDGQFHSPRLGVLYPTQLAVGQRITVEYDTTNPDVVRVAGRDASLSFRPALSIAAISWGVIAVLMVALAEWRRKSEKRRAVKPQLPADELADR